LVKRFRDLERLLRFYIELVRHMIVVKML
jgi:hypothetical protein